VANPKKETTKSARAVAGSGSRGPVRIDGGHLTVDQVVQVARSGAPVRMTDDPAVLEKVNAAHEYVLRAVEAGKPIYGVTTGFGGMADVSISPTDGAALQENLIWFLKSEAGRRLPNEDVRAAMLIRANTHLMGLSGLRLELVRRLIIFLNNGVTPHVREFGSIGASGDLVPLACITGAVIGLDPCFRVDYQGKEIDAQTMLARLGLPQLHLEPKEGLAMVNGTSIMSGMAATCLYDAKVLLELAMGAHGLFSQALRGSNQSYAPFIHSHKPHPGQQWAATAMLVLLEGSKLVRDELHGVREHRHGELIQDRYSLRCLPQFLGPVVDGLSAISRQVGVEINSATDNPLIDVEGERDFHGGNFLGQYIGVGMDQLRYFLGLTAKHLDAQIALLVTPAFSNGLPPSLVGNSERSVNMGLKGLQICGNSIMPLLTYLGSPLADRFATHAEQFNQNINSLGPGSARLARQAIDAMQQFMAVALLFGIQAVDLRTRALTGSCDAQQLLSPATTNLYRAVCEVVGREPTATHPYVRNDNEQSLSDHIRLVAADIAHGGVIPAALDKVLPDLP